MSKCVDWKYFHFGIMTNNFFLTHPVIMFRLSSLDYVTNIVTWNYMIERLRFQRYISPLVKEITELFRKISRTHGLSHTKTKANHTWYKLQFHANNLSSQLHSSVGRIIFIAFAKCECRCCRRLRRRTGSTFIYKSKIGRL